MVQKYVIQIISSSLTSLSTYHLYSALLELAPDGVRNLTHRSEGSAPFSQWLEFTPNGTFWHIHLLGEECNALLRPVIEDMDTVYLRKTGSELRLRQICQKSIASVDQLFLESQMGGNKHSLRFMTPTSFKSKGEYVILPTPRLLLQSLLKRFSNTICVIEDEDGSGLDILANGFSISKYCLESTSYPLKGHKIPAFSGFVEVENRLSGFHSELLNALLYFSQFSGIGIKTALGMGGIQYHNQLY